MKLLLLSLLLISTSVSAQNQFYTKSATSTAFETASKLQQLRSARLERRYQALKNRELLAKIKKLEAEADKD